MDHERKKILLIGWDAADWKFLTPLMDQGLLPNLQKLVEGGTKGKIATLDPPLSPTLWTSIATGKRPYKHGIHGFTEARPDGKGIRPIYNANRKVKAIWNMLEEHGMKSNVISWWPSHPAEKINGVMVSNFFQHAYDEISQEWPLKTGAVHPPNLSDKIASLRVHPGELTEAHILPFVPNAYKVDQSQDNRLQSLAKITADCASVQAVTTYLMEMTEWDLTAVYFDGIDHYCHGFMKYNPPYRDHILRNDYEMYNEVIKGACIYHDMMLGRLVDLAGEETNIILLSDHGFYPGQNRPESLPKEPAGPAYEHSPYGIIVLNGPAFKKDHLVFGASILDITPTILSLLDLPVGKDMDGRVLIDAFKKSPYEKVIDSWEGLTAFEPVPTRESTEEMDNAEVQQLINLGYIEDPGDDHTKAILTTENENKYYLARAYFDGGKWKEGVELLELLCESNPLEIRYHLRLIHGYQVIGEYRKAKTQILKLKASLKTDVMELDLMEGNLYLIENKPQKAFEIFNKLKGEVGGNNLLFLRLASSLVLMNKYDEAEDVLHKVIQKDAECQEAYFKLGFCHFHRGNYSEAVMVFKQSIGLQYYHPIAHYYLGEAFIALEEYRNAAEALETCLKLAPDLNIARQRLITVYARFLKQPGRSLRHQQKFRTSLKGEVIIVSGLPRSGTSMMMQMLEAGGLSVFTDEKRTSDTNNPKGYYEHEAVKSLARNNTWLAKADQKGVKVIANLLKFLPHNFSYKVIFMERELDEVLQSQQKMLARLGDCDSYQDASEKLLTAYRDTLKEARMLMENHIHFEVHYVNYKSVIEAPFQEALGIRSFLNGEVNAEKMASVVDSQLYREKINERQTEFA